MAGLHFRPVCIAQFSDLRTDNYPGMFVTLLLHEP